MSGGFWAGAVPPWAFVALVVLVILVIGGIALGAWYGYGRGFAHAEEEARWAREQAKARRTHPVYRPDQLLRNHPDGPDMTGLLVDWETAPNGQAIDTGEIQAITDRVDEWMATWIGDGHALRDS